MPWHEAEALADPVAEEVARRLGEHAYSTADEDLEQVVGRLLKAHAMTVGAAESLTGGALAVRLSLAPGASHYFNGSAVCYTAKAKRDILGVSQATLRGPGAVSEECAREMARGARHIFHADVAVSLTGVAGACMPSCHGCGASAQASAASAAVPITARARTPRAVAGTLRFDILVIAP